MRCSITHQRIDGDSIVGGILRVVFTFTSHDSKELDAQEKLLHEQFGDATELVLEENGDE